MRIMKSYSNQMRVLLLVKVPIRIKTGEPYMMNPAIILSDPDKDYARVISGGGVDNALSKSSPYLIRP